MIWWNRFLQLFLNNKIKVVSSKAFKECFAFAAMNIITARLIGYAPMLTPGKVRELRHPDWVADNTALTAAIGWRPRFSLEEGLRRTMGWGSPVRTA